MVPTIKFLFGWTEISEYGRELEVGDIVAEARRIKNFTDVTAFMLIKNSNSSIVSNAI